MTSPYAPVLSPFHHEPLRIADDTYVIRYLAGEGTPAPVNVYINSMVIRGREPIVVDTGLAVNRERWFKDVLSIVEPEDVRWIYISHDDHDHTGNLVEALERFPNATLVGTWFQAERLTGDMNLPFPRMRWLNDGESFDAGDRVIAAIRPPIYDSPTTRGLYDTKTGVYWAGDAFGTPVLGPTSDTRELDPIFWKEGMSMFNRMVAPWVAVADQAKFDAQVARLARLGIETIASGHGPAIFGAAVEEALTAVHEIPSQPEAPLPTQAELDVMLAAAGAPLQAAA